MKTVVIAMGLFLTAVFAQAQISTIIDAIMYGTLAPDVQTRKMPFEDFKSAYNNNLEKFLIPPVNNWEIKNNEAYTASYNFNNGAILIQMENVAPYYIKAAFYILEMNTISINPHEDINEYYALGMTLEKDISDRVAYNFCLNFFMTGFNTKRFSESGLHYHFYGIGEYLIITFSVT